MRQTLVVGMMWLAPLVGTAHPQAGTHNVLEYGAVGDGTTLCTRAFQQAVDRCAEGGGTVFVPAGRYLIGSIELKSNVEIFIQSGATVLGSPRLSDYAEHTPAFRSYNDLFLRHSLFYAERCSHIAIRGGGTIDGQGASFPVVTNEKPARYRNRPYVIRFVECRDVTVEQVTMRNSAMWMQQYLACDDVVIRGIRVFNHANKNNDMIDIDGCRNVVIADCQGDTDDDGITLKSTSERITENVVISNCIVSSHCNAVKTGTESVGGFRNIAISNIVITPSAVDSVRSGRRNGICGIALTLVDGGSMDGISVSNVMIRGPEVPFFIRLGDRARIPYEGYPPPGVGTVRNITLRGISATEVKSTGCAIAGLPGHPIEGVILQDVRISFAGGDTGKEYRAVPELRDQYPESTMWGDLPAYGLFARHVRGLVLTDVSLSTVREDRRPALVLSDVDGARVSGLSAGTSASTEAAVLLENTRGFLLTGSAFPIPVPCLLKLVGGENAGVSVIANDLTNVRRLSMAPAGSRDVIVETGNRKK